MRIRLLVEVDIKSSVSHEALLTKDLIVLVGGAISKMVNKEFQDPKNGLMLYIRSITQAPQVNVPAAVIPPREEPVERHEPVLEVSPLHFRKRMRIDERRRRMGLGPRFDPQTGRRLSDNG